MFCLTVFLLAAIFVRDIAAECQEGTTSGCPANSLCFLQQCYPNIGPCIGGICPPGFLCINGSCLNLNVPTTTRGTVTSSTTTTTTSPACVDLSAPGRPSDCPLRANLCNDPLYFNLMTVQCPRTCNRCGGQNQNSTCVDRVGSSGTSNCASVAYLCRDPLYLSLMRRECPRTCGYC